MIRLQPLASANAPWTRTMAGLGESARAADTKPRKRSTSVFINLLGEPRVESESQSDAHFPSRCMTEEEAQVYETMVLVETLVSTADREIEHRGHLHQVGKT